MRDPLYRGKTFKTNGVWWARKIGASNPCNGLCLSTTAYGSRVAHEVRRLPPECHVHRTYIVRGTAHNKKNHGYRVTSRLFCHGATLYIPPVTRTIWHMTSLAKERAYITPRCAFAKFPAQKKKNRRIVQVVLILCYMLKCCFLSVSIRVCQSVSVNPCLSIRHALTTLGLSASSTFGTTQPTAPPPQSRTGCTRGCPSHTPSIPVLDRQKQQR